MNKIGKEYISEVKTLFPIMGKNERKYINKLAENIDSYCEEENITSKQDLYQNYGKPNEVVYNYYTTVDTQNIVKRIKISKYIKIFIAVLLVLVVIATTIYCVIFSNEYLMALREEMVNVESVIE